MASYLSLDPELLEKTLRLSGEKTKKAAVTKALKEFVAIHEQQEIRRMLGRFQWDASYNHKSGRVRRLPR